MLAGNKSKYTGCRYSMLATMSKALWSALCFHNCFMETSRRHTIVTIFCTHIRIVFNYHAALSQSMKQIVNVGMYREGAV